MDGRHQIDDYVTIRLLFFAKAREIVGEREVSLKVPSKITGKDLLDFIVGKYDLDQLKCNVILALNQSWVELNSSLVLKDTDEVAVIPPLSGGTTRNNFEGKVVTKLEYEAYEEMAIKSLKNICENIRQKFDVGNIAIYHRLGDVPIEEASVVIAISSKHRKPALEAVPYAIDSLKADVPIWKKEVYDGEACEEPQWKENSESENIVSSQESDCIQLYEEVIEEDPGNEVPAHLIQINASLQEVNRRINSFITRKRQQINASNVQDFCLEKNEDPESGKCARVSAVLMRRKDSKSHLKVHRVENVIGPQTHGFDPGTSPKREPPPATANCPPGAEERLANAERYLNIHRSSRDVFSRLKAIEDKILFLESISPEYFDFARQKRSEGNFSSKRTYSSSELDVKMQQLEAKLNKKTKFY